MVHARSLTRGVGPALLLFIALLAPDAAAQTLRQRIENAINASRIDLDLDSITPVDVATAANLAQLRSDVYDDWVYPDGTFDGANLSVAALHRLGDQSGLPGPTVQKHRDFLSMGASSLQVGDRVSRVQFTLRDPTHGTFRFATLGYESSGGVGKFEPFTDLLPNRPAALVACTPGGGHEAYFRIRNGFNVNAAVGWGDVDLRCNGSRVAICTATVGFDAVILWEAVMTHEPETTFQMGSVECCRVVFHFGFASGFKSISIGGNGWMLSVTGALGWSGLRECIRDECCEDACFLLLGIDETTFQFGSDPADVLRVVPLGAIQMTQSNLPSLTVPADPALVGFQLKTQAFLYNQVAFPQDPIKFSPGLRYTIGAGTRAWGPANALDVYPIGAPVVQPGQTFVVGFTIRR